jgi:hypothetical protein
MDMNAWCISAPWSIGADVLLGVNHKAIRPTATGFADSRFNPSPTLERRFVIG